MFENIEWENNLKKTLLHSVEMLLPAPSSVD